MSRLPGGRVFSARRKGCWGAQNVLLFHDVMPARVAGDSMEDPRPATARGAGVSKTQAAPPARHLAATRVAILHSRRNPAARLVAKALSPACVLRTVGAIPDRRLP